MTAEEAAEALGVNVTTIYAYVSRKLLRSHKLPGARMACPRGVIRFQC